MDTKQRISALKSKLEMEQANLESLQSEYKTKENELSATIETKKAKITDFDSKIQEAAEAAARAAQEAQADNSNGGNYFMPEYNVSSGGSDTSYSGGGNASTVQAIVNAAYSQLGRLMYGAEHRRDQGLTVQDSLHIAQCRRDWHSQDLRGTGGRGYGGQQSATRRFGLPRRPYRRLICRAIRNILDAGLLRKY